MNEEMIYIICGSIGEILLAFYLGYIYGIKSKGQKDKARTKHNE